ncbi:hypothetical protein LINGRAHAP2_LOCUS2801 [Linum grandiflorum]
MLLNRASDSPTWFPGHRYGSATLLSLLLILLLHFSKRLLLSIRSSSSQSSPLSTTVAPAAAPPASVPSNPDFRTVNIVRHHCRRIPGRDACEIRMYHQEDAGLNVEMAKLAFARGIWSYVCKMHTALCKYSQSNQLGMDPISAVTLVQKIPPGIETADSMKVTPENRSDPVKTSVTGSRKKKLEKRPSRKAVTNGLLLIGGVICLSRGNCSMGAKVAMGYLLSKLGNRNARQSLER